jgi:signal transduction histidine kinase
LRLVSERVNAIVDQLQQRERDALQALQLAAVGQLAAGMAHELRNPLTSMKMLVQGAIAEIGRNGAPGCLHSVESKEGVWNDRGLNERDLVVLEEEILRLEQLVQSFLDFARPPQPDRRIMDIRPVIEQTAGFVSGRAARISAKVTVHMPPTEVCAAIDPGQFRQVLLNVILNALDSLTGKTIATGSDRTSALGVPRMGVIDITLRHDDSDWLVLQVTDNGCGLPVGMGDRIFEPFTTTKETGLGLGLSICRRIVKAHGGTITAANRTEGGAIISVQLPWEHTAEVR